MELGMGFIVGALAGTVVTGIVAMIIFISRRAVKKGQTAVREAPPPPARPTTRVAKSASGPQPQRGTTSVAVAPPRRTGHTMIVGQVESSDLQLNKNIQEVRDLLLHLANVIGSTETASGKAAKAFNSAKDTIDGIALDGSTALAEAQSLLVSEIDRVLKSNAELHSELDKANQGIAEQRRQIEELRVQARIDGLTRIANRAAFDERLQEYISLLDRTQLVFTLMLLDIDFFKRVNDVHGHINGDRILRGVAAKITAGIRNNDFAARYGGEEFAVIFPATDKEDAYQVADRMRQDIGRTNFRLDEENVKMTISGGIAQCAPGMTPEQVIAAADQALYLAKNSGRNRIIVSGDPEGAKRSEASMPAK